MGVMSVWLFFLRSERKNKKRAILCKKNDGKGQYREFSFLSFYAKMGTVM